MKRVSISTVVAVVALAGALVGVGVASAAHQSPRTSPVVMVAPSTGLTNGQSVMVSGSGFVASDSVYILECQANPTGQSDCNVSGVKPATIDSSGNLPSTAFTVTTGTFGTTTCGTSASDASNCVVEVANLAETDVGSAPITFATSSATTTTTPGTTTTTTPGATTTTTPGATTTTTAAPTTTTTTAPTSTGPRRVKSTPSTKLHNGEKVLVTGSGFTPGDHVFLIECRRGATGQKGCDLKTLKALTVTSGGRLPATRFKVVTGKVGTAKCGTTLANRNGCEISVGNAAGKDAAVTKISFKG